MSEKRKLTLRKVFVTGILFLLPAMITVFLVIFTYDLLDSYIAGPLGIAVLYILHSLTDAEFLKMNEKVLTPLIGFPMAIIIIIIVGYLTATFFGRRLLHWVEKHVLGRFPIVSAIYPHAKKLTVTFLDKDKKAEFKAVVALEYPRQGIYSIGFVTSDGLEDVRKASGKELLTVFMPSSPTPFTGYTIQIAKQEAIYLNMSVDAAIRFSVSGGILTPDNPPRRASLPATEGIRQASLPAPEKQHIRPEDSVSEGPEVRTGQAERHGEKE